MSKIDFDLYQVKPKNRSNVMFCSLSLLKRLHLVRRAEEKREKLLSLEADYRRCAETFHARPGALVRAFFLNFLQSQESQD